MFPKKYLIRLDDACPGMNTYKWDKVERILDKYNIKPLIAVIPNDIYFSKLNYDNIFWEKVTNWKLKDWEICMHGYNHDVKEIVNKRKEFIFFAKKTEFTNFNFEVQQKKILQSEKIFNKHNIFPRVFIAPNHSLNKTTINVLKKYSRISIISDSISIRPYIQNGMLFIPQVDWKFKKYVIGTRTICIHPSTMSDTEIEIFEINCNKYSDEIITINEILKMNIKNYGIIESFCSYYFKFQFKFKNIIHKIFK